MSDNVLRVFPVDPGFVPSRAAAARAVEQARQLFSGPRVEIETTISNEVVFVDNGVYLQRIVCPRCGSEIDLEWWRDRMEETIVDFEPVPASHLFTVPCCGAQVGIDELVYHWPVGFARFVIDVWNPDPFPEELDPVTDRLAASVGSPMRGIWAHY